MALKVLMIYIVTQTGLYVQSVTLTPSSVDVWENSDVTLNCTDHTQFFEASAWDRNGKTVAMQRNGITCTAYGFLTDRALYSYSCPGNNIFSVTLKKISRNEHADKWKCMDFHKNESNVVTIYVKVLVQTVTLFPKQNVFTTVEYEPFSSFQCVSNDCRPQPMILWYRDQNTNFREDDILLWEDTSVSNSKDIIQKFTSTLRYTPNRFLNGWYIYCVANNSIEHEIISDKILLDITYPPDQPPRIAGLASGEEYKVLEGRVVTLTCSVTGGNPLPQLEWNKNNNMPQTVTDSTVTKLISWKATKEDKNDLTCTSVHLHKNETTRLKITVLFPPDTPTIIMQTMSGESLHPMTTINVIERIPFIINCSANSNPPVSMFEWSEFVRNTSSGSFTAVVNRNQETLTCKVFNQMNESNLGQIVTGTNTTSMNINVLYPPKLNLLVGDKKIITEGDNFNYSCIVTNGKTNFTNVTWSWAETIRWYGQQITLKNISRYHTGVYQCCVRYTMISSDGNRVEGNESVNIPLHVEYTAKVLNFCANDHTTSDNLTVSENIALNVTCEIEGNPFPQGALNFLQASYIQIKRVDVRNITMASQTSTNLHLITRFYAKCTDSGNYTCIGWNTLNNGSKTMSTKSLTLFVRCKPRKSPYYHLPNEVYSEMASDVTLSFTALAYPVPPESGYVWYKESVDGNWTAINISSSDDRIIISTSGLQSNLSIKNITLSDYGNYKVIIANGIGQFEHTFNLTYAGTITNGDVKLIIAMVCGATGGVLVLLGIAIAVVLICKSSKRFEKNTIRDPRGVDDSQTTQAVVSPSSSDGENSHFYEELQNAGKGREYENLQLTPIKEAHSDG